MTWLRRAPALRSEAIAAIATITLGVALALAVPADNAARAQPAARVQPEVIKLVLQIDGTPVDVVTDLYKPAGDGPFAPVIFSHGRAGSRVERSRLRRPILVGHANYWLAKGVAVVAPVRPGYGETGGADREDSHARWQGDTCIADPDFTRTADKAREVVQATYQWALAQPWVRKDRILLEGQSVGGMTTVATGALNLPGVLGFVNFAGGAAGNPDVSPGKSCKPDNLVALYRTFGQQVKVPSLWLYAENDLYWGPQMPRKWFDAFRAGGSDSELVQTPALEGHDGHKLLEFGGRMWHAPLDAFVRKVGLLAP